MIAYPAFAKKITRIPPTAEPKTWTAIESGMVGAIYGVQYDGSTYWTIASANATGISTSTDVETAWTQTDPSPSGGQLDYDGTNWASGHDLNGQVITATNPTGAWSTVTPPNVASGYGAGMFYGSVDGIWIYSISTGAATTLWTTTDPTGVGDTWTSRTHPFGTSWIYSFSYEPTSALYVAVATGGKIAYTTDPTGVGDAWTLHGTPGFAGTTINRVACIANMCVAVGASNKIATATSPSGTWTQRTSALGATTNLQAVGYGNGAWVIAGKVGATVTALQTCVDPTGTWTERVVPDIDAIYNVRYGADGGDGHWVLVGQDSEVVWAVPYV